MSNKNNMTFMSIASCAVLGGTKALLHELATTNALKAADKISWKNFTEITYNDDFSRPYRRSYRNHVARALKLAFPRLYDPALIYIIKKEHL